MEHAAESSLSLALAHLGTAVHSPSFCCAVGIDLHVACRAVALGQLALPSKRHRGELH